MTEHIRYDDQNISPPSRDGLTWETAFANVPEAVADLPTGKAKGVDYHHGTIYIGRGMYVQPSTLELNLGIRYIGIGSGWGAIGTMLYAANGLDAPIIAPTAAFKAKNLWNHHCVVRDLQLRGNSANQTVAAPLIETFRGGDNFDIQNLMLEDSLGFGILFSEGGATASAHNLKVVNCQAGAISVDMSRTFLNLNLYNTAIDRCGVVPVVVSDTSPIGRNPARSINLFGIRFESATAGEHDNLIEFRPNTNGLFGDGVMFGIHGLTAAQNAGGGTSVFHETDQPGIGAKVIFDGITTAQQYTNLYSSAKNGTSVSMPADGMVAHLVLP